MTAVADIVVVTELTRPEGLADPIALYRDVFALRPDDPAPSPRLLAALARNGGIALGAYMGGELVGFSYGFPGLGQGGGGPTNSVYHYMELLVVRADRRGSGIGRALMFRMREIALSRGLSTVRWAYDPLRVDNAYFYLDVLGARGCEFVPNLYGIENSGRDRGHPTDRIIAGWDLTTPAELWPEPPPGLVLGVPVADPGAELDTVLLAVPAERDIDGSSALPARICAVLKDLLASGLQAVSCRRAIDGSVVYRLVSNPVVRKPECHRAPRRSGSGEPRCPCQCHPPTPTAAGCPCSPRAHS